MMDDPVDESALDRMWPRRRYGARGDWFAYVGRQYRQRNGMTRLRPDRGPRGRCGSVTADAISGEILGTEPPR